MYPMSKKSLIGRIFMLPFILPVILVEAFLSKCDDWYYPIRRLRMRMEDFANNKFPLKTKE